MKHNIISINPSEIYFTHSRIRNRFTGCNKLINDTFLEITTNKTPISDIPMITVFKFNNNYYSYNNRRLYLFKELYKIGIIQNIDVYYTNIVPKTFEPRNTYSLNAKPCLR
jgi:hypothetical protein